MLPVQAAQVDIPEVDLGEGLVLVTDVVEIVPLEPEAGEGPVGGSVGDRVTRTVEVTVPHDVAVARRAADLPAAAGIVDRLTAGRTAEALDDLPRQHFDPPRTHARTRPRVR